MAYNDMNGCGNKCEAYVDLPLHTTTCRHWTHAIFHLRHSTPCASDAMPLKELSKDGEVREERVAGGGASWRHLHSRCLLASALATLRDACHCSWNGEGKDKSCWGGGRGRWLGWGGSSYDLHTMLLLSAHVISCSKDQTKMYRSPVNNNNMGYQTAQHLISFYLMVSQLI